MRTRHSKLMAAVFGLLMPVAAMAQDWQPVQRVETYAIRGQTGIELYRSIGDNGPGTGVGRAIAHTSFKLTWTRKYEPQPDGSCMITRNYPKLIITTVLPKPASKLSGSTAAAWQVFIDGVHAHERVHGDFIVDMVREIELMSVGLSVPDDRKCSKIRQELTRRLGEISQAQRARSRDFDMVELNNGGNVHQLVLNLVNTE